MKMILKKYDKAEEYVLIGSLVLTATLVFIQVIMRYVFNASLSWSEELTRYIFIWQIWLGASIGLRDKKHIRVEVIQSVLKPNMALLMDILANLIWMAACTYFVYNGFQLVFDLIQKNSVSTALRIPLWTVYAALPVSCFVIVIRQVLHLREDINKLFYLKRGA
ncbi:MAG: TRAP transporter small permease subunit [Acidaminobacter sp.]|uniref:TRAP transporter small permease n=1 Tax=Acidaminobacter sp. TaxID=1872102 RepID=UPI001384A560|nr:TRAP transporter small permease [Acidaminobacter sp.]MZQ97548.1 TRAP transporter small permease subunit [Acidaminobacter sp.]